MFLKNKNNFFKIIRSKVTDYAALNHVLCIPQNEQCYGRRGIIIAKIVSTDYFWIQKFVLTVIVCIIRCCMEHFTLLHGLSFISLHVYQTLLNFGYLFRAHLRNVQKGGVI